MLFRLVDRIVRGLSLGCLALSGIAVLAVLAIGTADTVGTQLVGRAVPSAIELMEALEVVLIFGALPWVARTRSHIAMDLLTARLSPLGQHATAALAALAGTVLFGLLARSGWELARRSYTADELSHGFIAFPLWPFKAVLFLACTVSALECLLILMTVLSGRQPAPLAPEEGA